MQSNNTSFQKMQKKNRQFDDGLTKKNNSKKFKTKQRQSKQTENY